MKHPPTRSAWRPLLLLLISGCSIHQPADAPTTRPSLATTQPTYWLSLPATSAVVAPNFDQLWLATQRTAHDFGFVIDRLDQRTGLVTTEPLTSKQFFEFWRNDVVTLDDLAFSSIATYRRTLRFQISKVPEGGFRAEPAVVIERHVRAEKTITSSIYLRSAFATDRRKVPTGTPESDQGIILPSSYWYPTGRDTALEQHIANDLANRVAKAARHS